MGITSDTRAAALSGAGVLTGVMREGYTRAAALSGTGALSAVAAGPSSDFPFVATAAETYGWGTPTRFDDFLVKPDVPDWWVYDGAGHGGNGTRTPDQVFVDTDNSGVMSIIGTAGGATGGMSWNGTSHPDGQIQGKWEVAMRTSAGSVNYHPVLLTWPDNNDWTTGGELDFCELNNSADRQLTHFFLHWGTINSEEEIADLNIDCTQWHAWALEWTPTEINAYCDGVRYAHFTNTAHFPTVPHSLCLQLDNFGGDVSAGGRMDFAWVKQWDPNALNAAAALSTIGTLM